jgi:hypothetical protein
MLPAIGKAGVDRSLATARAAEIVSEGIAHRGEWS